MLGTSFTPVGVKAARLANALSIHSSSHSVLVLRDRADPQRRPMTPVGGGNQAATPSRWPWGPTRHRRDLRSSRPDPWSSLGLGNLTSGTLIAAILASSARSWHSWLMPAFSGLDDTPYAERSVADRSHGNGDPPLDPNRGVQHTEHTPVGWTVAQGYARVKMWDDSQHTGRA
jgi:hypothetical protein